MSPRWVSGALSFPAVSGLSDSGRGRLRVGSAVRGIVFAVKGPSVNFELNTDLLAALVSPGAFLGHAAYGLLVLSMMMRNILWLRIIALASGFTQLAYDSLILQDPVSATLGLIYASGVFDLPREGMDPTAVCWNRDSFLNFGDIDPRAANSIFLGVGQLP